MKRLFHFLGGVQFAILLIASVACLVILGTFVESKTESHRLAARLTYSNPVFTALLWGFFINILFAALRRWPFQWRHLPFLITHWGLLMILGGVLVKSYLGTQGTLTIVEGSGSQEILLPDTYVVHIEKRDGSRKEYPIQRSWTGRFETLITQEDFTLEMLEYFPHGQQKWETWIKGDHVYVTGLKPFQVFPVSGSTFPVSSRVRMAEDQICDLIALRSEHPLDALRSIQDLKKTPCFVWVQDPKGAIHFMSLDPQGHAHVETFDPEHLKTYVMYDEGYGGYAVYAKIPYGSSFITLETPLTADYIPEKPGHKLEELKPILTLKFTEGTQTDVITLLYDRYAQGFKWPVLKGKYLVRFQPAQEELPYRVRLRQARQINYPHTQQPYSFESDVIITDLKQQKKIEKTLSMNNVHETWDGYRFYMASLSPSTETAVRRVQIAVNHDPAKYFLTYPGAFILTLGILLLFWFRS